LQKPANPDLLYIIFFCHTQLTVTLLLCLIFGSKVRRTDLLKHHNMFLRKLHKPLICDKNVTTQNLAFLSYWYRKKRLQNTPLESSCVVVALIENYNTSKSLKVSPEKSQILICDTVVANKRHLQGRYVTSSFVPTVPTRARVVLAQKTTV